MKDNKKSNLEERMQSSSGYPKIIKKKEGHAKLKKSEQPESLTKENNYKKWL